MWEEEAEFLENYKIDDFERPSIAVDIVVFSIVKDGDGVNYRKDAQNKLKVLLVKRAEFPFKDFWALPGGFVIKGESPVETARRELKEETNVEGAFLRTLDVIGDVGRDPRGWIISNSYIALVNSDDMVIHGGSDTSRAEWFNIEIKEKSKSREIVDGTIYKSAVYELYLNELLVSEVEVKRVYANYHESVSYNIIKNQFLAFDHAKIIVEGILKLRDETDKDGRVVFDLLPDKFTFADLQKSYEIVLDKEQLVANFRRKMSEYVIETDLTDEVKGHRPAKLFIRNLDKF